MTLATMLYQPVTIWPSELTYALLAISLMAIGIALQMEWRIGSVSRVTKGAGVAVMLALGLAAVIGCIWICGCDWFTLWCAI